MFAQTPATCQTYCSIYFTKTNIVLYNELNYKQTGVYRLVSFTPTYFLEWLQVGGACYLSKAQTTATKYGILPNNTTAVSIIKNNSLLITFPEMIDVNFR